MEARRSIADPTPRILTKESFSDDPPSMARMITTGELTEELRCPICLDISFPPLYNCTEGHTVCGRCKELLLLCPVCRSSFKGRNFVAEGILAKLVFKCKYRTSGCSALVSGKNMLNHISQHCSARPVGCFFCNELCSISSLVTHMRLDHKMGELKELSGRESGLFLLSVPFLGSADARHEVSAMKLHIPELNEHEFILCQVRVNTDWFVYFVMMVGLPRDSLEYSTSFTVWNNNHPSEASLVVKGTCYSVRDTPYDIWARVRTLIGRVRFSFAEQGSLAWQLEMRSMGLPWIMFRLLNRADFTLKLSVRPKEKERVLQRSISLLSLGNSAIPRAPVNPLLRFHTDLQSQLNDVISPEPQPQQRERRSNLRIESEYQRRALDSVLNNQNRNLFYRMMERERERHREQQDQVVPNLDLSNPNLHAFDFVEED